MTTRAVFAWPLLLAIASLTGLVAGLLGAGAFDLVCWLGLALPVGAAAWAWHARQRGRYQRRSTP